MDEIVTFHALTRAHLGQIVEIQLRRLGAMLAERGLTLRLTDRARDLVAEAGYDPPTARGRSSGRSSSMCRTRWRWRCWRASSSRGDAVVADVEGGRMVFAKEVAAEIV